MKLQQQLSLCTVAIGRDTPSLQRPYPWLDADRNRCDPLSLSLSLSFSVPFKFLHSVPLLPPPQTVYTELHVLTRPISGIRVEHACSKRVERGLQIKINLFLLQDQKDGRGWPGRVERRGSSRLTVGESGVRLFFDDTDLWSGLIGSTK